MRAAENTRRDPSRDLLTIKKKKKEDSYKEAAASRG